MSCLLSLTRTLCVGVLIRGDPIPILLQSVKNLSSEGAGVGGVLCGDSQYVEEESRVSLPLLSTLIGIDYSSSCLSP